MNFQKYAAELVGTFGLTLAVSMSLITDIPLATPLAAGLTLGLFVYTVGPISGAHLNPAVTVGLASIRKISLTEGLIYIISQILGALLAMFVAQGLTGGLVEVYPGNTAAIGWAEALGTFFLVFGVSSVAHGKVSDAASGLVIGGSLLLGILLSMSLSNGVLNPAVAIGIESISVMYLLAPLGGGIAAAWVYRYIAK